MPNIGKAPSDRWRFLPRQKLICCPILSKKDVDDFCEAVKEEFPNADFSEWQELKVLWVNDCWNNPKITLYDYPQWQYGWKT